MRKRKPEPRRKSRGKEYLFYRSGTSGQDNDDWLVTYSDMITLLFAFFVVIVAISQVDPVKMERVSQSMATSVGKELKPDQEYSLQEIYANLQQIVQDEGLTEQAEVNYTPLGVAMRFKGNLLFGSASATLAPDAEPVLAKLAGEIKSRPFHIAVEGHTDNRAIETSQFPSNWELSAARASSVVRFFLAHGVQTEKLRAVGRADTQPLVPNQDREGNDIPDNQALNRRVEIIFLATADQ